MELIEKDLKEKEKYLKEYPNKIKIIYHNYYNEEEIKIFGSSFVSFNKDKYKIIYNNKKYELQEKFKCKNVHPLEIELIGILYITNMYAMFADCTTLINLPDIHLVNTNNVKDMSYMFKGCSSLSSLPDISRWNTNNVTRMDGMFKGCSSLSKLPDISRWNTSNVMI